MSSESTSPSWSPQSPLSHPFPEQEDDERDDAETASQRSISLHSMDSPRLGDPFKSIPLSPTQNSTTLSKRESHPYTLDTDLSSENDDTSLYTNDMGIHETPDTSAAPSVSGRDSPSVDDAEFPPSKFKGFPSSMLRDSVPQAAIFNILPTTLHDRSTPSPPVHKSFLPPELVNTSPRTRQTPPEWVLRAPKRQPIVIESLSLSPSARKHPTPLPIPDAAPSHVNLGEPPSSNFNDSNNSSQESQPTYPPTHPVIERESVHSFASNSSYSKKIRPESTLLEALEGPIVLGLALVSFDNLIGPKIEYSKGDIFQDGEISKILPFLALPDGSHSTVEDFSYFHLVPSRPNPTTIFCISCNRKVVLDSLDKDVARSAVQKAIVVLASKPVFGPIRDKLGVVTRALFNQRDFTETDILKDFAASLEPSLRTQLTESGLYMGTSIRELVHTFRQRTLVLLKALILQKRIMFYGQNVERLCTYQYSLVSLVPGLLQTLDDCGSPPLAVRAPTLSRPTSLRTSDHKSMLAYLGLPLDIFGKDAFFQPYLPLQQLDILRGTKSWLCGSTNPIVPQQREFDLLVNIETGAIEFRDATVERSARLTAADRKWMDDIVRDVNVGWNDDDPTRPINMHFKGSDDYLRLKFEEYVSAALASVRYRDFVARGERNEIMGGIASVGDAKSTEDFNPLWIHEFKKTNAYEVWERTTDPLLFDIVEPRHPCNEKPSVVADLGLRLQEGIQELKLDQQLAPTREVISRSFNASSTNFLKAMEGVGRWARSATYNATSSNETSPPSSSTSSTPSAETRTAVGATKERADIYTTKPSFSPLRQLSLQRSSRPSSEVATDERKPTPSLSGWGSIGSFWTATLSLPRSNKNVDADTAISNAAVPPDVVNPESGPLVDDLKSLDDHPTQATSIVTGVAV